MTLLLPAPPSKRGRKPKAKSGPHYPVVVEHAFSALPSGKNPTRVFRIEIRSVESPTSVDSVADLDWICQSLGFFGHGAGSKKALRLFREIVFATESNRPVSSTDLARALRISRGATLNYLNQFIESGLVVKSGRWYFVRNRSIFDTIAQIESDIDTVFKRMRVIAKKIDRDMGIHDA